MTIPTPLIAIILLAACELPEGTDETVHQPTLEEIDSDADATVSLIDRADVLAAASENEAGQAPDLGGANPSFFMEIDSTAMSTGFDDAPAPPSFNNVQAAYAGMLWADAVVGLVVGPPAAAIAFAADGELTEHQPWLWTASNTTTGPQGESVTANFNVAWIGVGWLAEMRISTSDGTYDDTLWFNGFLHHTGGLGWWDIFHEGQLAGVVEWVGDGNGNWEAGIGSVIGETTGDALTYWGNQNGEYAISYFDFSESYTNYARLYPDNTGEVALINHLGGDLGCWDTNWEDTDCPPAQ